MNTIQWWCYAFLDATNDIEWPAFWLINVTFSHFFITNFSTKFSLFFLEKPTVKIPASTVRALSGHWLWCSAVGTPSVDITITNNDEVLVTSSGYALIRVYDEGTYTCTAKNQAGIDSKEIQVSLTASKNTLLINNPFGIESWAGWESEGGGGNAQFPRHWHWSIIRKPCLEKRMWKILRILAQSLYMKEDNIYISTTSSATTERSKK